MSRVCLIRVFFYQFSGLVLFSPWMAQLTNLNYTNISLKHLKMYKCIINRIKDQVKPIDTCSMVRFCEFHGFTDHTHPTNVMSVSVPKLLYHHIPLKTIVFQNNSRT